MIYREFLVMRKALAWFFGILLTVALVSTIMTHGASNSNGDISDFLVPSAWVAVIFATMFGVALGNASRGPARIMWVLPAARWRLAAGVIAVDGLAILVAYVGTYAVILAYVGVEALMGAHVTYAFDFDWGLALLSVCFPLATYGWCALIGMIGRRVAYIGIISWPGLMLWFTLAGAGGSLGETFRLPVIINPCAVFIEGLTLRSIAAGGHPYRYHPLETWVSWMGTTWEVPLLVAIAMTTCAAAALLWQRSQVLSV